VTTAREAFIANKLIEKGGVVNKVAANYVRAGFNVRINPGIGDMDIIAIRSRDEKYCMKVLWEKRVYGEEHLTGFIEACKKNSCKPVIILYGSGPSIDEGFLKKNNDIKVRRIRAIR
jgi:hypothetical protein